MCNLKLKKMKMKWKSVGFALALAVGMTMPMVSCSDSGDDPNPPVVTPDEDLEEGYFSFQSAIGGLDGTKALATDVGTEKEQLVHRVRMVFYDATTHIAEYAFDYSGTVLHTTANAITLSDQDYKGTGMLDPTSADAVASGYDALYGAAGRIVFMPKAFKMIKKPYKLLVLANPTTALEELTKAKKEYKDTTTDPVKNESAMSNYDAFKEKTGSANGNDLTAFIGDVNSANPANLTADPANFLMTNYQEYVNVTNDNFGETESAAYAKGTRVVAKLDRAVAKVSVRADYAKMNADTKAPGTVSDGTWLLDITNKSSYWMRHMTYKLGGTAMETYTDSRDDLYAFDTNMAKYSWQKHLSTTGINPGDLITTSEANVKEYFNYVTGANVLASGRTVAQSAANNWGTAVTYEYALENTMDADEQYEDVTTAAVLRAKYVPKGTAMGNTLGTVGYFVWKGYVFTGTELVSIKNFDPGTATPGDIPKYETFLELQKYLITNETALEGAFGSTYNYNGVSKREGQIEYNADGFGFYRILIRHFNDGQEPVKMAYGRFGIVRNNWYRLTINSIAGPGSIDVPKPEGPDDKEYFIAVEIEVLPWLVRDQIVDIE